MKLKKGQCIIFDEAFTVIMHDLESLEIKEKFLEIHNFNKKNKLLIQEN